MTARRKKWLIALAAAAAAAVAGLLIAAAIVSRRYEPYIKEQAVKYLRERFDSEVELGTLQISMPSVSTVRLLLTHGRGAIARVRGSGLSLRYKGRRDIPPMLILHKFSFNLDLGLLFEDTKTVALVTIDGMEITIPPKGERPKFRSRQSEQEDPDQPQRKTSVIVETVLIGNATLSILPRDKSKTPLRFDIRNLRLDSAGRNVAMKYDARLTNPRPPGLINSQGHFGPWTSGEPSDTPLDGKYTFEKADLSVFKGIAGILHSTGEFKGTLGSISARGQATVPAFQLKRAGNPVPLSTKFEVLVDGTNGNTILKPVIARLGSTGFTTSGGVIKHDGDRRRSISLDVSMPRGQMRDLLRLATRGAPFMEGEIEMKAKIDIPPLSGKVKEKLLLDGVFEITNGKFLKSKIQDQLDTLSRRAQGQPRNQEIDEVVSRMGGKFQLDDQIISFEPLSFAVPGAGIDLAGRFDMEKDQLDFHGTLRMQAKVSQTMTGWKRWVLKPVDPFFAKNGAGTLLKIKVEGTAKEPKFGLDRGKKNQ